MMRTKITTTAASSALPVSLRGRQSEVTAAAWDYFVSTGRFPEKSPRAVITRSWRLSRDLGINPDTRRADTVLSLDEIDDRLHREQLGQVGVPVLEQLVRKFDGSEHVLVLADREGCILHSTGHHHIRRQLDAINFMPGARWTEDSVGPNGIGTPLALQRPEVVMGYEHYCRGWQPWVCYGAPVYNTAAGKFVGVVDITGPVKKASSEAMILAVSVAQSIQYGLNALTLNRREQLRTFSRDIINRWSGQAVLLIDEDGFIIDHNNKALRYLDRDDAGILNKPLSDLIAGIWDTVHARINRNAYGKLNIDIRGEFGLKRPVQVHVEPVSRGDQCYGAVLVLSGSSICRADNREPDQDTGNNINQLPGRSTGFRQAVKLARAAAGDPNENGVLLIGESGSGRELLARSIHSASRRGSKAFVTVNCGTLPTELTRHELFGCVPGLLTGSGREGMSGKFEQAQHGTLFLEDIHLLGVELQASLLHVLENRQVSRLGSNKPVALDIRVMASASGDMQQQIEAGTFRRELGDLVNVFEIPVPPLRDRGGDVIELANIFLEEECWYANRDRLVLSGEVIPFLERYSWPGNVRELRNLCVRWALTVEKCSVTLEHLPEKILISRRDGKADPVIATDKNLKTYNDEIIRQVLVRTGGNVSEAARQLGINRTTIYRRKKKFQQQ